MKRQPLFRIQTFSTGLIACLAVVLPFTVSASSEKSWLFRVYLDDKEIGYHHFHLTRNGRREKLTTRAKFDVAFLKIPLFRYRHENAEIWDSQCLESIASTTDENGKQFRVDGNANGSVFQLTTPTGDKTLPACISTFAYWDKSFLNRDRLLNPQTGEYLDIDTDYLGVRTLRVGDMNEAAHHYQLTTDEASIELWYSDDGKWLALRSTTKNGRVLRYVRE